MKPHKTGEYGVLEKLGTNFSFVIMVYLRKNGNNLKGIDTTVLTLNNIVPLYVYDIIVR